MKQAMKQAMKQTMSIKSSADTKKIVIFSYTLLYLKVV